MSLKNGDGRAPCCGWSGGLEHLGSLFQHYRTSEENIAVYPNTTKVPNWNYLSPGAPGPDIDPYPRQSSSILEDAGDCAPDTLSCGGPGTAKPGCDAQDVVNTFGAITRVNFATCRKFGHKRVRAQKYWQGRRGFLSSCDDSFDPPHSTTPTGVTYLRMSWTMSAKLYDTDSRDGDYFESFATGEMYVDQVSGMMHADSITVGCQHVIHNSDGSINEILPLDPSSGDCIGHGELGDMEGGCIPVWYQALLDSIAAGDPSTASRICTNTTHSISYNNIPLGRTLDATINLSDPVFDHEVVDYVYAMLQSWPLNDDVLYPWRHDGWNMRAPLVTVNEGLAAPFLVFTPTVDDYAHPTAGSGTPTDPYTAWQQIPWFYPGSYTWTFPPGVADQHSGIGTLVPNYDGSLRGLPKTFPPIGADRVLTDKYWDGRHPNYEGCYDPDTGDLEFYYISTFGRWNIDDGMPASATQWTAKNEENTDNTAAGITGHWIRQTTGMLVQAQKEAIIQQPTPSQNYFGPSGPQRFAFDSGNVDCITAYSGGTVTLFNGLSLTVGSDDLFRVRGSDFVTPGIYKVTKIDNTHFHLDTLVYDLSSYTEPIDAGNLLVDEPTSQFGRVRYPKAWPIQGRAMITSATQDGSNVDLVIEAAPYLRTGDTIDVIGVVGLGTVVATVTDPTHISVPGTVLGYTNGGYIISHGAPDWSWYDSRVKGDYVLRRWLHNYRDYIIDASIRYNQTLWGLGQDVAIYTAEDHCLCWKPCCPSVICSSPNGETWTNGVTHPFPASTDILLDVAKGFLWQGIIQTTMGDIYWIAEPEPCVANVSLHSSPVCIAWKVDDGSCQANQPGAGCDIDPPGIYYYPMQPQVEARDTLPAGAPALPPGIFIGCLSQATMLAGPPPPGVHGAVALPPAPGGGESGSWMIWQAQLGCVQGGGQFASVYATEIII